MSLDDLNREQKRSLKRMGALNDQGLPTRAQPQARRGDERVGPLQYLREVRDEDGRIVVELTPTYTGCPAVLAIELAVEAALHEAGFADVRIERVLSPAWSTDDITATGRDKLRAYGIAPPEGPSGRGALVFGAQSITCPRCGSRNTNRISEFGSTACKALWRCEDCREPFDYFKCL